jgi:hypothetical protein
MSLSDYELHGAYRDLHQNTLAELLAFARPEEKPYLDGAEMDGLVQAALADGSTKLQRCKTFELALWHYNGNLASPLDQLLPRMMTEDQPLTIDIILDVWMRRPTFIVPLLVPYLETTHHPERLRQMIGACAGDLARDDIDMLVEHVAEPAYGTNADRVRAKRELQSNFTAIATALRRFQSMQHRVHEIHEFASDVILDLKRALDGNAITEREYYRLQKPFLECTVQLGRQDTVRRARRGRTPEIS